MPRINLTAKTLAALKPVGDRQVDYFDASLPGFCVRVSAGGQKSFGVLYRFGGRFRRLTLGGYPPLSLADARDMAREALRSARLGSDPVAEKKQERAAETFAELAEQYLERYARKRKSSWREDARRIKTNLNPVIGNIRAKDVTRADVRRILETIAERGAPIEANRTLAVIRKIYNWAIGEDLLEVNPAYRIPAPGAEHKRDRVLTHDEIRAIWKDLDNEEPRVAAVMRLRLLTGQRGGEIASMESGELDLRSGWWTIPAEKAKNGLSHRVPLTAPAVRIIEAQPRPTEGLSYVFPALRKGDSVRVTKENLVKATERIRERTGITDFTAHDLRRTAASMMTSMGIPRLTVSKILNHVERGVTAVYDRHSYDKEKREALEAWGRRLQMIVSGLREVSSDS